MKLYAGARETRVPTVLTRKYPTWQFNPKFPREHPEILERFQLDPIGAARDFGCEPPGVQDAWMEEWRIDACVDPDMVTLIRDQDYGHSIIVKGLQTNFLAKRILYKDLMATQSVVIACDPGSKTDNFGVVLAYLKKVRTPNGIEDHVMIGGVLNWAPEKRPPREVDFMNVTDVLLECTEHWDVPAVVFDQWQSISAIRTLLENGVRAEKMTLKPEDWVRLATLVYQKHIHFLANTPAAKKLIWELKNMILLPNGKVDHSPMTSSDLAVCVARACKALVGADAMVRLHLDEASHGGQAIRFRRP
jgi:hypothetical protein